MLVIANTRRCCLLLA